MSEIFVLEVLKGWESSGSMAMESVSCPSWRQLLSKDLPGLCVCFFGFLVLRGDQSCFMFRIGHTADFAGLDVLNWASACIQVPCLVQVEGFKACSVVANKMILPKRKLQANTNCSFSRDLPIFTYAQYTCYMNHNMYRHNHMYIYTNKTPSFHNPGATSLLLSLEPKDRTQISWLWRKAMTIMKREKFTNLAATRKCWGGLFGRSRKQRKKKDMKDSKESKE